MTTPILFFAIIFLGLRFWPWLRLFVAALKTSQQVTFSQASEIPSAEASELLGVAARELEAMGCSYRFSLNVGNGVVTKH